MPATEARCEVEIHSADGLHLRIAAQFARLAATYQAEIRLSRADRAADGKSVMDLLTLAVECGSRIALEARGADAEQAIAALGEFLALLPCESVERQP